MRIGGSLCGGTGSVTCGVTSQKGSICTREGRDVSCIKEQ